MTPEDIAIAFAVTIAAGVVAFLLLAFAPEIEDAIKRLLRRDN